MRRTTILAVVAVMFVSGCLASPRVTGRADNDMLRFSALNYAKTVDTYQ